MPAAPLRWRKFSLPKRGHRPDEYEDAAVGDGGRGRFAITDGATESAFAGDWARLLAEAFVREPAFERRWDDWLPAVRTRWLEAVGARELPWYLEEKLAQGAFATLLGLELSAASGGWDWRAMAVGDCCLFHVRGVETVSTFPMDDSAAFNASPELLGSRPTPAPKDHRARGKVRPGDRIVLATDALAQWLLRRDEQRRSAWPELLAMLQGIDADAAFKQMVDAAWETKELRIDDVTLLVVELPAGGDA